MMISELRSTALLPHSGVTSVTDQQLPGLRHAVTSHFPPDSRRLLELPESSLEQERRCRPYYSADEDIEPASIRECIEATENSGEGGCGSSSQNDNSSVCELVCALLLRSGYPLTKIDCHCFDRSLALSGSVAQYYHLQVALEIAKQSAGGRQLDIQIQVRPQTSPTTASRTSQS